MEIALKNIAKIKEANISIRGITVIAGENDTGKSTVSKALFSMFHGFYHLDEKIRRDRRQNLVRLLHRVAISEGTLSYSHHITINLSPSTFNNSPNVKMKFFEDMARDLLDNFAVDETDTVPEKNDDSLSLEIKKFFKEKYNEVFSDDLIDVVVPKILDLVKVSSLEIGSVILSQTMNIEFYNQINSLNSEDEGRISLTIKRKTNSVTLKSNKVTQVEEEIPIETDVIYFDSPLLIDQISVIFLQPEEISFHNMGHREWLIWNLQNKLKYPYLDRIMNQISDNSATREIIVERNLKKIYEKLNIVCEGTVTTNNKIMNEWVYRLGDSEGIFLKNLSTGLKTFVILKSLLQNGTLSYGGTLILDEPEIHLHPKWQLILAELIVLLNKEFQIHVLLNTHSPYFLRAIEVYSRKYCIADQCDYYLAELNKDKSEIKNVNHSVEEIYKKLWIPFQKLEDEIDSDE